MDTCSSSKQYVWKLDDLFNSTYSYGLLLLNNSVTTETSVFLRRLWCHAQVRVCVDGGTNNYHRLMRASAAGQHQFSESSSLQYSHKSQTNDNRVLITRAGTDQLCINNCSSASGSHANALPEKSLPLNNSNGCQEMNGVIMPLNSEINSFASVDCTEISAANLKSGLVPLPHFICGDFDSIEPGILQHYTTLGVEIVPTPDQNETDFMKALRQLDKHLSEGSQDVHHVLAAVSISHDRFDHVLANINTLHMSPLSAPVVLVSPSSVLLLLREGRHELVIPRYPTPDLNWCAYAPCAGPAIVTTSGLKWDVSNTVVQFGGLVSTSNQFAEGCSTAFITTDRPLLFIFNRSPDDATDPIRKFSGTAVQTSTTERNGGALARVDRYQELDQK